ncbi:hypothetical protein [Allohahella sp. A8]|uniref:hypothetical protein n=1 Tax=Allohahella sp. A8 TaxID=3141461 RepID=UPI003A7F8C57
MARYDGRSRNKQAAFQSGALALVSIAITLFGLAVSANAEEAPCWMETLVTPGNLGQIGIARNIHTGGTPPKALSEMRAISGLCNTLAMACDDDFLKKTRDEKLLAGRPLFFDSFIRNGQIYAYAAFSPVDTKQCKASACRIDDCDPAWLCSGAVESKPALLGISYRSMSTYRQTLNAMENALLQAEYMFGVDVEASSELNQGRIGEQNYLIYHQEGNVDTGAREVLPFHIAHQCESGDTLYQQVVLDLSLEEKIRLDNGDLGWVNNPKHLGLDGAVGIIDKRAASGLVSDQVKLAIKQAAIQLAFEKSTDVTEDNLVVTSDAAGLVHITKINQQTNNSLKARVMRIRFDRPEGAALRAMAWLVIIP